MAVVKPLVFYDDTKRVEFMRVADTAPAPAGSGISRSVLIITTATTGAAVVSTDYVYLCSGITTFTLPTAVGNTNLYTVKNTGVNTITIATTTAQTIDGGTAPITITRQNNSLDFISNGTNWFLI